MDPNSPHSAFTTPLPSNIWLRIFKANTNAPSRRATNFPGAWLGRPTIRHCSWRRPLPRAMNSMKSASAMAQCTNCRSPRPGSGPPFPTTPANWRSVSADNHTNIWRKDLLHPHVPAVQMFASTRPQDNAQYSPDGRHVVFDSLRSGTWSIWLADSDGSNLVQITKGPAAGFPRWSPNSRKVAFVITEPTGLQETYTADISDHVPHKLKTNVRESDYPYWSHDGNWIYFLGREGAGHPTLPLPRGRRRRDAPC